LYHELNQAKYHSFSQRALHREGFTDPSKLQRRTARDSTHSGSLPLRGARRRSPSVMGPTARSVSPTKRKKDGLRTGGTITRVRPSPYTITAGFAPMLACAAMGFPQSFSWSTSPGLTRMQPRPKRSSPSSRAVLRGRSAIPSTVKSNETRLASLQLEYPKTVPTWLPVALSWLMWGGAKGPQRNTLRFVAAEPQKTNRFAMEATGPSVSRMGMTSLLTATIQRNNGAGKSQNREAAGSS